MVVALGCASLRPAFSPSPRTHASKRNTGLPLGLVVRCEAFMPPGKERDISAIQPAAAI